MKRYSKGRQTGGKEEGNREEKVTGCLIKYHRHTTDTVLSSQTPLNGSAIIILFLLWKTSLLTITVPVQGIVHYLFPITSLGRNGLVCGAGCWKKTQKNPALRGRFDPLCWGTARQKKKRKINKKYRMGDGSTVGRAVERCGVCSRSIFRLITWRLHFYSPFSI